MGVAIRDALTKVIEQKPEDVITPEEKHTALEEHDIISVRNIQHCLSSESAPESPQSAHSISIESFVIGELLSTERTYVSELESLVEYYVEPFHSLDLQQDLSVLIRGRSDLVFGNLRELLVFHSRFLLPELLANENSSAGICRVFTQHADRQVLEFLRISCFRFLQLYRTYCQNKAASDALRIQLCEVSTFFEDCQRRACHPLPLGAYLLKPVQRITKYQLLLRELERHCRPEVRSEVTEALSTMLELLAQINATIHHLHISGFNMSSLGFSENSRFGGSRFDLWDEAKSDAYVIELCDVEYRSLWIVRLSRMVHREGQQEQLVRQRPKSWTSTISNESTCSASTKSSDSEVLVSE
ncbi:unnamed protein product [Angiostrongylus costaricensis]|uniref:DH domain-containing protein n=1 Tax=Angiostrongylus costaricensis TaxID=334426 RepID=A0A0R3PRN2_ANGCS|nr:unnamed protein product [Angiostrongylus costaricensis]